VAFKKLLKAVNAVGEKRWKDREGAKAAEGDESNWLVSYADMMTLLCGFFIMLFSMAKLDDPKYESFKEEVSKQFGGQYQVPESAQMARLATQILQEQGMERHALVNWNPSGIAVIFESTVFFDTLSADVRAQGEIVLSKLIDGISQRQKENGKHYRIVVEGHTDSRPIVSGVYPSNWELSAARASKVVRMFLDRGFEANRLTAIGYGDTHPRAPERTPAGSWDDDSLAHNRRVVLRILEPNVDSIPFPEDDKKAEPASAKPSAVRGPASGPAAGAVAVLGSVAAPESATAPAATSPGFVPARSTAAAHPAAPEAPPATASARTPANQAAAPPSQ
jgi:chemotaxis protein MotB